MTKPEVSGRRDRPRRAAFIHQGGEGGGGECFGVRADAKHGEFVNPSGVTQLAHAVALGYNDLAVFYDGHGHAGDVEGFHRRGDVSVEVGWRRGCGCWALSP
jgi:hypothetical protein